MSIAPLKSRVLDAVRRGRPVAWTPDWMRLGNVLYVGLWAFEDQARRCVLLHPERAASLDAFPELRKSLFVDRARVRFTDQRAFPWRDEADLRARDRFEHPLLDMYVRQVLMPGSPLRAAWRDIASDSMVVNVRRGDYFTPAHEPEYGLNTVAYTLEAVEWSVRAHGVPGELVIVSDDLAWCREHLDTLREVAPVRYRDGGPVEDLAALVAAPRLVIPNSTFSYWGGYIGDALHEGREVVAPWMFNRHVEGGRSWQLRPSWTVVEDIPGGW